MRGPSAASKCSLADAAAVLPETLGVQAERCPSSFGVLLAPQPALLVLRADAEAAPSGESL
eukprot:3517412-Pyramimonas_sp.AAC.1